MGDVPLAGPGSLGLQGPIKALPAPPIVIPHTSQLIPPSRGLLRPLLPLPPNVHAPLRAQQRRPLIPRCLHSLPASPEHLDAAVKHRGCGAAGDSNTSVETGAPHPRVPASPRLQAPLSLTQSSPWRCRAARRPWRSACLPWQAAPPPHALLMLVSRRRCSAARPACMWDRARGVFGAGDASGRASRRRRRLCRLRPFGNWHAAAAAAYARLV